VAVYRDTGVVLRVTKLGEADRIVTLLTRRTGRVRAVAKGVRRTSSKFGGRLEPFSHVDLQFSTGRSLDIVLQAESLDSFGSALTADYRRYTAATVLVETSERLTAEEREPSLRLYLLLVSALRALAESDRDPSLLLDSFLLRAMGLSGWAPALDECARCGNPGAHEAFSVSAGGVLCPHCRSGSVLRPTPSVIALMGALASGDWKQTESVEARDRRDASGLIAALLQWHLERGLRSLPLVDRGFADTALPGIAHSIRLGFGAVGTAVDPGGAASRDADVTTTIRGTGTGDGGLELNPDGVKVSTSAAPGLEESVV
jgi:DNA repair protein RecO (recombination protein O)